VTTLSNLNQLSCEKAARNFIPFMTEEIFFTNRLKVDGVVGGFFSASFRDTVYMAEHEREYLLFAEINNSCLSLRHRL